MNTLEQALTRFVARQMGRVLPIRHTSAISHDPTETIGIATIKIVTEEQVQAIAYGRLNEEPKIITRLNPLGRDVTDLIPFADFLAQIGQRVAADGADSGKDICYEGQHKAIVDLTLWGQVQEQLKVNAPVRQARTRKTAPSLLIGKLFDASGDRLAPSHAIKRGRRYRYYVSYDLKTGTAKQNRHGWRLPAQEIERTIIRAVRNLLCDHKALTNSLREAGIGEDQISAALDAAGKVCEKEDHTNIIIQLIERADLRQDGIRLTLALASLIPAGFNVTIIHDVAMQMKRRGVEMRLVIEGAPAAKTDSTLIRTVARARKWFDDLLSGQVASIPEIAARNGVSEIYVSNLLPAAFLPPDIVYAIQDGCQPADLTSDTLTKHINLPLTWPEQRSALGRN